ncbi:hypothetical protein SS21_05395 [Enterobacter roggenkampii]|uniref:hypothetical protein n=1 Tax=Enterobacter roggenkampii TaxID=1812935 RepID=UPI0005EEEDC8|nr:hypothetical protein [Enterobacter roggenkampii]KJM90711.1 hypothetical protein SS21_05395 [Enterobacter roggenkampii]KJN60171.1 hypothetical protein SS51_02990 [Enterobacter roggenkampii]WIJ48627.1 hypothetical protein OI984_20480 [Enterobacter roggenkampii]WIJ77565.1 hypothetical protein OI980_18345 [Enterobacter roggenkampii]
MHPFELLKRQLDEMAKSRQVEQAQEEAAARELRKARADLSLDEAIALYVTQLEASTEAADLPAGHRRVIINKAAGRTLKAINLEGAE